ncbi:hypothetical protein DFAR_340019 [Desulfarculales bacterium]
MLMQFFKKTTHITEIDKHLLKIIRRFQRDKVYRGWEVKLKNVISLEIFFHLLSFSMPPA